VLNRVSGVLKDEDWMKASGCHISAVSEWETIVTPNFDLSFSFFPVNFLWVLVCFGGFYSDDLCEHFP
jgi:hypothetical protein